MPELGTTRTSVRGEAPPPREIPAFPVPNRRRRFLELQAGRIVLVVALIGLWALVSHEHWVDPLLISRPAAVWRFIKHEVGTGTFWTDLWVTLKETILGFAAGGAAGILTGLLFARLEWLDAVTDPVFTFLNALPRIALAPLFILWFGIGSTSKVVLAASLVFFILLAATRAGVKSVDPQVTLAARVLGASPAQLVRTVILPGAVPSVFGGLRLGVVYSLLGVIAAEMVAAQQGLGKELTFFSGSFDTAAVLGTLFFLGVIGAVLNGVMVAAERRLLRWRETQ